jgi:hypothetical protein
MNEVIVSKKNQGISPQVHIALSEIAEGMRKVVNSTIDVAIIIAKHESKDYWSEVEDALLNKVQWFDRGVMSMYKKIGNNLALRNEENRDKLPLSYNTLYQLAFADAERLNQAIDKGTINVNTTLKQAKEFKEKDLKVAGKKKEKEKEVEPLSITVKIRFADGKGKTRLAKQALNAFKMSLADTDAKVTWTEF